MKKLLLSSAALVGLTAGALAADLPARRAPPAPFVAVPVFTWTGFYVGVNAGYGFSDRNNSSNQFGNLTTFDSAGPGASPRAINIGGFGNAVNNGNNSDGFIGGGQIGYNYQFGQFVIGLEADIQYSDFGGRRNNNAANQFGVFPATANQTGLGIAPTVIGSPGNVAFFNNNGTDRMEFFGTVRGRVGYAIDRLLIFGTGGLAYRDSSSNQGAGFVTPAGFFVSGPAAVAGSTFTTTNFNGRRTDDIGYAVGGGVEYAFTPNLSAKIEGLYVNFGGGNNFNGNNVVGVTNQGAPVVATGFRRNQDTDFGLVRAGLNYKFNLF